MEEEIRELRKLEKQPPATVVALLGAINAIGQNAFHVAAEVGDPDILKTLLKAVGKNCGALINARDASGATPIFTAVKNGCKHAVRELAKVGADTSIADQKGNSTHLFFSFQ